ncbi:MAG: NAD-glutamate dehydrogenase [Acidimicrobiia bacterium]|nr:NAD-glutamate dehydrogenase [Acidimicrobiia bacterium]
MRTHTDVAETVSALIDIARQRRPTDDLLAEFVERYYRELPPDDADARRLDAAYAAAVTHLALGRRRAPREILVELLSPDVERDGWRSERSVLMFVTDDVPFLVDTVRMVLDRHGLGIHLLVHPMLPVVRDQQDRVVGFDDDLGMRELEAWTLIELDRCPPEQEQEVANDVRSAIAQVQQVVDDFGPMRERMRELADGDPLLDWLGEQHFVFLGAASYERTVTTGSDGHVTSELTLRPGSELGEYRTGDRFSAVVADPPSSTSDEVVVIARAGAVSAIHRSARFTSIAIRPSGTAAEHRFIGLLGSGAYRESVFAIPTVGTRAAEVLALAGASTQSFTGRAMKNVVETLPRDLVFELDPDALARVVTDIVGLQERRIVRVFDVAEPVGPWTTVFVYVPRARFDSALPDVVERLVGHAYEAEVRGVHTLLGASSLVRISMTTRSAEVDLDRLATQVDAATATWDERAEAALVEALGEVEGRGVFHDVRDSIPSDYKARVPAEWCAPDLIHIARLRNVAPGSADALETSLGRSLDDVEDQWRFRVFRSGEPATIAELVPLLGHLGLHAVDERPYVFDHPDGPVHLYDIGVFFEGEPNRAVRVDQQLAEVRAAFAALVSGEVESDGLNRLILAAGLRGRQVAVLRTYSRYLQQAGFPFSQSYIENALVRHADLAHALAALFDARFDPRGEPPPSEVGAAVVVDAVRADVLARLDLVPSLDDDRICRAVLMLIDATLRTNAFRRAPDGGLCEEIAIKLDPSAITFLPEPRPMFEIWVCSPKVEGVHLRGGRIARGGLRWSDRAEDFRTEVLGLVKAQMVKNAVIVPVGAKGGFVVKRSRAAPADRDAVRAEGVDRYQRFIRALLDLTDNLDAGSIVPPPDTVIYDGDDPYLVVAADKGTATFSDIANELAIERGFWLGDAFASGGSVGYDHKEMGITARGAWESVRRHARVLGLDADRDELLTVGIGDMSGDVFGNGMLLSEHLRLVAAFDHRHVFLDPDPDPAAAHAERRRLFELPRSSWTDYDDALISPGGGVYPRTLKSIPVSAQVRAVLGMDESVTELTPAALISGILRAPVDLLWNGGIGTYVKASAETDESVGDRHNDAVRVDADELRCRIIGEGGNLGITQLARVEYAVSGGLVYTDAIDNSAGVDCSDHEVNIKVLLDQLVRDGELTLKQRNRLLADMTGEVADLVLDDNRSQTLALMVARNRALSMINVHARYLESLEAEGVLDRSLEFLPTDKQIAERQALGSGLRAPEFAVMIAYTKNGDIQEILDTDLPDDPVLVPDLMAYFPEPLRKRYPDAIRTHRLAREITATVLVNDMVNLAGISFDHRMTEDSGASVPDVARAYVASRNIYGFGDLFREIDDLGSSVELDTQLDLFRSARAMVERGTVWLLRHRHPPLDTGGAIEQFAPGIRLLGDTLDELVGGVVAERIATAASDLESGGVPSGLARRAARWPWMHPGFDIVEMASEEGCGTADTATAYWSVFESFDVAWLWDGIGRLPRSDRWQTQARSALRDDLLSALANLAAHILRAADGSPEVWIAANERAVARAMSMYNEIRRAESFDLTTLSVALRQLRNLMLTSTAPRRP